MEGVGLLGGCWAVQALSAGSTASSETSHLRDGPWGGAGLSSCRGGLQHCIQLPLRMASAVNYLMNLPLQVLGFCFLQIKKLKKAISVRLHLTVFQACGVSFPALLPEKKKKKHVNHGRAFQGRGAGTGADGHKGASAVLGVNGARDVRPFISH